MNSKLTNDQWALIRPHLPLPKKRGRPRAQDRRTINGILNVLGTGCRWQDLPPGYGSPVTCGKPMAAARVSGEPSSALSMSKANWTGVGLSWMAASSPLKRR
jgi:transposase